MATKKKKRKVIIRPIVSPESKKLLKDTGQKVKEIVSFFPQDPHACDCFDMVQSWREKLGSMHPIKAEAEMRKYKMLTCPKSKEKGMRAFEIVCNKCKDIVAIVHAKDKTLKEWCNLHYISWHNTMKWRGCFGLNISPIDGKVGLECCCGNDTRDFRTTMVKTKLYQKKKVENMLGRNFGKKGSKFRVRLRRK